MTGNFVESNPIPVKAAMKMLGIIDVRLCPVAARADHRREPDQNWNRYCASAGCSSAAPRRESRR